MGVSNISNANSASQHISSQLLYIYVFLIKLFN